MAKKNSTASEAKPAVDGAAKKDSKKTEKPKSVKPEKPSDTERDAKLDEFKAQIEEVKKKQSALKEKIDKAQSGKEEYQEERTKMWDALKKIDDERKTLKEQKDMLLTNLRANGQEKKELRDMERDTDKNWNEDMLKKRIQELEYQLQTSTMSLKDEKQKMADIKSLKKKLPEAAKKAAALESLRAKNEAAQATIEGVNLEEQLSKVKEEITRLMGEHQDQYKKIQDHQDKRSNKMAGSKDLIDQRKALSDQIQEINSKRDTVWDEYKEKSKEFNNWEKAERMERRKKQDEQWQAQQAMYDAQRAEHELEQPSPFLDEIYALDQAVQFCKELLPKEQEEADGAEKKDLTLAGVEGAQVLMKKSDREAFFTVLPKKKQLKKKGAAGEGKTKTQAVKHTSDTLQSFASVKLPPPMNLADVATTLAKLTEKLGEVNAKTAEWEADRKKKIEDAKTAKADAKADGTNGSSAADSPQA